MDHFLDLWLSTGVSNIQWGQVVMMGVGFLLLSVLSAMFAITSNIAR